MNDDPFTPEEWQQLEAAYPILAETRRGRSVDSLSDGEMEQLILGQMATQHAAMGKAVLKSVMGRAHPSTVQWAIRASKEEDRAP